MTNKEKGENDTVKIVFIFIEKYRKRKQKKNNIRFRT